MLNWVQYLEKQMLTLRLYLQNLLLKAVCTNCYCSCWDAFQTFYRASSNCLHLHEPLSLSHHLLHLLLLHLLHHPLLNSIGLSPFLLLILLLQLFLDSLIYSPFREFQRLLVPLIIFCNLGLAGWFATTDHGLHPHLLLHHLLLPRLLNVIKTSLFHCLL